MAVLPGFSAGGGITGPSSPGDIYVTPTIAPVLQSPVSAPLIDSRAVLLAGVLLLAVMLFRK